MSQPTRSPIKDKPLRSPGQSLEEERRNLFEDKIIPAFLLAAMAIILAAMEWVHEVMGSPPQPVLFTLMAAIAIGYAAWVMLRLRPKTRALRLGIEGEKTVGQLLDRLRENGYEIFHDLIGTGFNIDHVLIGPAGVFTVETKTWSKPSRGQSRIKFDGERLIVEGREPERNPVIQARAQSVWIKNLLAESTGRNFDVFPVVVFPGWYIEHGEGSLKKMWVLEPKALPKFLGNEPQRLTPEDVKLASFHLSRFIRSGEQQRDAK